MNLEINHQEKVVLLAALEVLEEQSIDVGEVEQIYNLFKRVESLKPTDLSVVVMDEEGRFLSEGEEVYISTNNRSYRVENA